VVGIMVWLVFGGDALLKMIARGSRDALAIFVRGCVCPVAPLHWGWRARESALAFGRRRLDRGVVVLAGAARPYAHGGGAEQRATTPKAEVAAQKKLSRRDGSIWSTATRASFSEVFF
jgi:hypothetical protein